MPVINDRPTAPQVIKPIVPVALPVPYHSPVVDSRYTPLSSLLVHVEGASWITNYYQQVLDRDSELSAQQIGKDAIYQSYYLIRNLEFRVNTELSTTPDAANNENSVTGSATLYPGVQPNVGDMFIADIGDGREGVFTVTGSECMSLLKDTCYKIEYALIGYNAEDRRADLLKKVIKTSVFVKDFIGFGQNPVLLETDYNTMRVMQTQYTDLLSHYFGDFYSREYQTLVLPDQTRPTYDGFLVRAVLRVLDTNEHHLVQRVTAFNTDDDQAIGAYTLWDCLTRMSQDLLPMSVWRCGLIDSAHFSQFAHYQSVFYSGMRQVVYPKDARTDIDAQYDRCKPTLTGALQPGKPRTWELSRFLGDPNVEGFTPADAPPLEGINALPDTHLVTVDDYYVLSEAFYTNATIGLSKLEVLVGMALKHQPLNLSVLSGLCSSAKDWGNLERFYYIPVLLILLKTALRGF